MGFSLLELITWNVSLQYRATGPELLVQYE